MPWVTGVRVCILRACRMVPFSARKAWHRTVASYYEENIKACVPRVYLPLSPLSVCLCRCSRAAVAEYTSKRAMSPVIAYHWRQAQEKGE